MLRAYVSYEQTDWDEKLVAAEFAYNSATNASTKASPFMLNYGQQPSTPSNMFKPSAEKVQTTAEFLTLMGNLTKRAKDELAWAKARQEAYANQHRRDVQLREGDMVLLSAENINLASQTARPSKKLQTRYIGPYRVSQIISTVAYRLELPPDLRIHPVFHISCLKKYTDPTSIPHRPTPPTPPPAIVVDGKEEFEVEKILDKRKRWRRDEYLVKWKGYPEYEATWEPRTNLTNVAEAMEEFGERRIEAANCVKVETDDAKVSNETCESNIREKSSERKDDRTENEGERWKGEEKNRSRSRSQSCRRNEKSKRDVKVESGKSLLLHTEPSNDEAPPYLEGGMMSQIGICDVAGG